MIAACRRGEGAATTYEIARVTIALQHLRAGNDFRARIDPVHRCCRPMVRRAQPGYVAAPASLLALVKCR